MRCPWCGARVVADEASRDRERLAEDVRKLAFWPSPVPDTLEAHRAKCPNQWRRA